MASGQDLDGTGMGDGPSTIASPTDTPSHRSFSRRSSRFGSPLTDTASSPPPIPQDKYALHDEEPLATDGDDEPISVLDPRRFTPTLHASLVSEILSLRRELDSKNKLVEDLEVNLSTTKSDNESLDFKVAQTTKENRAFRHQLQDLEKGTVTALEDLVQERDQSRAVNTELREKLEAAQKKIRANEEDYQRTNSLWEKDRESWDVTKRTLERKAHVSEVRLKAVIEELQNHASSQELNACNLDEDETPDSGLGNESDTSSVHSIPRRDTDSRATRHNRTISNTSQRSVGHRSRFSVTSRSGRDSALKMAGVSLADELNFDDDDEDSDEGMGMPDDNLPGVRRNVDSRQSTYMDEKAKRVLGLTNPSRPASRQAESINRLPGRPHSPECQALVQPIPTYVDTGIQFSPPPSPPLSVREEAEQVPNLALAYESQNMSTQTAPESPKPAPVEMISSAMQTDVPEPAKVETKPEQASSISTQTEDMPEPAPPQRSTRPDLPPIAIPVPSIAIHPPQSTPSSPKESMLPPCTKNVSCQTTFTSNVPTRSVSVQTEQIRVDKRSIELPAHLLPSAISATPMAPPPRSDRRPLQVITHFNNNSIMQTPPSKITKESTSAPSTGSTTVTEDRYPGNNDNGPLARDKRGVIRRPFRTSSLFAGFDGASSDEEDPLEDDRRGDEDFDRPISAATMAQPFKPKHGRQFTSPPTPVPEEKETETDKRTSVDSKGKGQAFIFDSQTYASKWGSETSRDSTDSKRNSYDKPAKVAKSTTSSQMRRSSSIRRSLLIQSGALAHLQRARSPSDASTGSGSIASSSAKPPFPVPTRSSSRRVPVSKSEGSTSPTHRGSGVFRRRQTAASKSHARKESIRKVRSATTMPRRGGSRSPSPPPVPNASQPGMSEVPPLPNDTVSPRIGAEKSSNFEHRSQPSSNMSRHTVNDSTSSAGQSNVVDAIAATMVGEWMWKYVRRRSFGVMDPAQDSEKLADDSLMSITGNGVRHKRWVWLSPYERSVMWSSKQPTTEGALLGKNGRKLPIQSVLDVRDETPMPKSAGAQPVFNRSILILTPQRALKFTATSRERHHLWLTALSFLAHSAGPLEDQLNPSVPDMTTPAQDKTPLSPPTEFEIPKQRSQVATLRRAPIRDSVRLAKTRDTRSRSVREDDESAAKSLKSRPSMPDLGEAAMPPTIPRFSTHHPAFYSEAMSSKRSFTAPRSSHGIKESKITASQPPPLPRSFSAQTTTSSQPPVLPQLYYQHTHQHHHTHNHYIKHGPSPTTLTASTTAESLFDHPNQPPSVPSSLYNGPSAPSSEFGSSASTCWVNTNFFDPAGTVRMEAFVDRIAKAGPAALEHRKSRYAASSNNDSVSDISAAFAPAIPRLKSGRVISGTASAVVGRPPTATTVPRAAGWGEEYDPFREF